MVSTKAGQCVVHTTPCCAPTSTRLLGFSLNRGSSRIPRHWHNCQSSVPASGPYSSGYFEHGLLLPCLLLALSICRCRFCAGGFTVTRVEMPTLRTERTTSLPFAHAPFFLPLSTWDLSVLLAFPFPSVILTEQLQE